MQRKSLGKGLSALIPLKIKEQISEKSESSSARGAVLEIPTQEIERNPMQPRRDFSHYDLEDLINSIRKHGIIQPLIVSKSNGKYQLIAGERRLRAAKILGLEKVPAITRDVKEHEKLEIALIENIQRKDLNPIEKAWGFYKLIQKFNLTQEELAKRIGKSRPLIANTIRLLELPEEIQKALIEGKISEGHGRTLVGIEKTKDQLNFFKKILQGHLTVREAEKGIQRIKGKQKIESKTRDINLEAKISALQEALGTKVEIKKRDQKGQIIIDFYSKEELAEIIRKITS